MMDDYSKQEDAQSAGPCRQTALTEDEKNWGMFCHVAVFAGCLFPFGNIIGPLVIWLMKKDLYPFVDYNARQAMNFQITLLMALFASLLLSVVLIGVFMMIGLSIFALVATIRAILASGRGEYYRYPCSIQFIR